MIIYINIDRYMIKGEIKMRSFFALMATSSFLCSSKATAKSPLLCGSKATATCLDRGCFLVVVVLTMARVRMLEK